jgi:ankyrin repeat protein
MRDADGNYPINVAASQGKHRVVAAMIAAGADINAKGDHGKTPLMCAAENGHSKVVDLLIRKGADLERRGNGKTALLYAAYGGSVECVRMLVEAGANLAATSPAGQTALAYAYSRHNAKTVLYLLGTKSPKGSYLIPRSMSRAALRAHAEQTIRRGDNRRERETGAA